MEREPGFYWVLNDYSQNWEVWEYNNIGEWYMPGSEHEAYPDKVNEQKLIPPAA